MAPKLQETVMFANEKPGWLASLCRPALLAGLALAIGTGATSAAGLPTAAARSVTASEPALVETVAAKKHAKKQHHATVHKKKRRHVVYRHGRRVVVYAYPPVYDYPPPVYEDWGPGFGFGSVYPSYGYPYGYGYRHRYRHGYDGGRNYGGGGYYPRYGGRRDGYDGNRDGRVGGRDGVVGGRDGRIRNRDGIVGGFPNRGGFAVQSPGSGRSYGRFEPRAPGGGMQARPNFGGGGRGHGGIIWPPQ
jgi:hypothetical protein